MKNSFNVCRLLLLPFFSLVMIGCEEQITTAPNPVVGDVFIFDTIQVNVRYDATPGFKYPLMEYNTSAVAHLTEKGVIDTYIFNCDAGNIQAGYSRDYISLQDPGYRFKYNVDVWSQLILDINKVVPYSLYFSAWVDAGKKIYTISSSTKVEHYTNGIQPEPNSLQLTGPENRNYSPKFSPNGSWIYYRTSDSQNYYMDAIFRTDLNGNGYEKVIDFTYQQIGACGILDDNHLVYVKNGGQFSSIVIKDLGTMNDVVYPVNGNLWGTEPVKIPNTNKFLNFTDPNKAIDFNYRLVTADIVTQKVDTVLKNFNGDVQDYTINPHNNNIYLCTVSNHYDIIEYNPITEKFSIFLGNTNIKNLRFFPDNYNCAYIRQDQNGFYNIFINTNGIEKQLTEYPADVTSFSISPNGDYIVFSAYRRNELQSWIISIN